MQNQYTKQALSAIRFAASEAKKTETSVYWNRTFTFGTS